MMGLGRDVDATALANAQGDETGDAGNRDANSKDGGLASPTLYKAQPHQARCLEELDQPDRKQCTRIHVDI